jgi:hypothetical protein
VSSRVFFLVLLVVSFGIGYVHLDIIPLRVRCLRMLSLLLLVVLLGTGCEHSELIFASLYMDDPYITLQRIMRLLS